MQNLTSHPFSAQGTSKDLPQACLPDRQASRTPGKFSRNNQKSLRQPSRHIPAEIKREVENRSEGICEYPNCFKPAEHFHHAERFALTGRHTNIRNLCKAHHELAHQGLIDREENEPSEWKLQLFPDLLDPKFEVDRAVRKYAAG